MYFLLLNILVHCLISSSEDYFTPPQPLTYKLGLGEEIYTLFQVKSTGKITYYVIIHFNNIGNKLEVLAYISFNLKTSENVEPTNKQQKVIQGCFEKKYHRYKQEDKTDQTNTETNTIIFKNADKKKSTANPNITLTIEVSNKLQEEKMDIKV